MGDQFLLCCIDRSYVLPKMAYKETSISSEHCVVPLYHEVCSFWGQDGVHHLHGVGEGHLRLVTHVGKDWCGGSCSFFRHRTVSVELRIHRRSVVHNHQVHQHCLHPDVLTSIQIGEEALELDHHCAHD